MTRDDIIRMAREADGIEGDQCEVCGETHGLWMFGDEELEVFAFLIAAAERERLKWDGIHSCHSRCDRPICVAVRKAVEAEREACAKVCEDLIGTRAMARHCADAIRARSNA
jgi:hypothetical protein